MTTRISLRAVEGNVRAIQNRRARAARVARVLAALAGTAVAALPLGSLVPARAGAVEAPVAGPGSAVAMPSDTTATLRIETLPSGLIVFVDGEPSGRSPLVRTGLRARRAHIRVLRADPRRVDRDRDEADVWLSPGDTAVVRFDLRPPLAVESQPRGALLAMRNPEAAGDSLLGSTPLAVPRALLPDRLFLLRDPCCADTALLGSALLALEAGSGTARITLRPVIPAGSAERAGRPIYRRRWLHWGMIVAGAGLTGASALLKREGDRWYDRYLDSSDRTALDHYFDQAVHYDHLSLAALGVGQALFTGGLVLLLSHSAP